MKTFTRNLGIAVVVSTVVALSATAFTQPLPAASPQEAEAAARIPTMRCQSRWGGRQPDARNDAAAWPGMQEITQAHGTDGRRNPTMPGQECLGAIQDRNPTLTQRPTKVNLRRCATPHDMNEVTLRADATAKPLDGDSRLP